MPPFGFEPFTRLDLLKGIDRRLLESFLASFSVELGAANLEMPGPQLDDENYWRCLARFFSASSRLPRRLSQSLELISCMARPEASESLAQAAERAGVAPRCGEEVSPLALAILVWLAGPIHLERAAAEQPLPFACFHGYSSLAGQTCAPLRLLGQREQDALERAVAGWFADHGRGRDNVTIDVVSAGAIGRFWFRIRHGDRTIWTDRVEGRDTVPFHFRGQMEDLVLCLSPPDDLWVKAGTMAEREFYRESFGYCFRGRKDHFFLPRCFTLEALRWPGHPLLGAFGGGIPPPVPNPSDPFVEVSGAQALNKVISWKLKEVRISEAGQLTTYRAAGLFASGNGQAGGLCIPPRGTVTAARLEFQLLEETGPRLVCLEAPNTIKLQHVEDLPLVVDWLKAAALRLSPESAPDPGPAPKRSQCFPLHAGMALD